MGKNNLDQAQVKLERLESEADHMSDCRVVDNIKKGKFFPGTAAILLGTGFPGFECLCYELSFP